MMTTMCTHRRVGVFVALVAIVALVDVVAGFDGVPYGTFVDACTQVCAGPTGVADLGNDGLVGMLVGGPSRR